MKAIVMAGLLYLGVMVSMPALAQTNANSSSGSSSSAGVEASQGNQQNTLAGGGSAALNYTVNNPGTEKMSGAYTVHANPGMVLEGPGMSYSNFNCANGTAAGASSFWASFSWSGSHESTACNFRANAALQAQIDATPHAGIESHNAAAMAEYVTCTTSGKKVLQACMQLGLVVNADTPSTTSSDTWHACHVNATMLGACKREHLVSQSDEPLPDR